MQNAWFSEEEEIKGILIRGFLKQGVHVWDCRGEAGKCPKPLKVLGIPLILKSGDFFIFWNGRYYAIELKFAINKCGKAGRLNNYYAKRFPIELRKLQMDMLFSGGGILVIVAEPILQNEGIDLGGHNIKNNCERALKREFKSKLGTGEIPYEVWILSQTHFKKVWNDGFGAKLFFNEPNIPLNKRRKKLGFSKLKKSVPESRVEVAITDFLNGKVVEIILQILRG